MKLTQDQENALQAISNWWNGDNKHFILSGEPGVGKTFLAKQAVTQLGKAVPLFTAPTNEAAYQLGAALGDSAVEVTTTHKALGLGMTTHKKEQTLTQIKSSILEDYNLLVVDEASFPGFGSASAVNGNFNADLLDYIIDDNIRVLWLGDPEQLPPINSEHSPVFTEEFTKAVGREAEKYHMSDVVRHSGDLLDFVRALRSWKKTSPFPKRGESVTLVKPRNLEVEIFKEENFRQFIRGESKLIAWTNKRVDELNQKLRVHRYGAEIAKTQLYCPGDQILFASPLMVDTGCAPEDQDIYKFYKQPEYRTEVTTNAKAEVAKVTLSSLWGVECYALELRIDGKVDKKVLAPTVRGKNQLYKVKSAIATDAKALSKGKKYGEAGKVWEQFHAVKLAFADLKHAYAITGHRSQGSSIPVVWADVDNLLLNKSAIVGRKNLYVSCSRAKQRLVLITNRSK